VPVTWPATFDAWFLRCVARDPAARFQSVGDAAAELDLALSGKASTPAPTPVVTPEPAPIVEEKPAAIAVPVELTPEASKPPASSPSRAPYALVAGALVLLALALGAWLRFGS